MCHDVNISYQCRSAISGLLSQPWQVDLSILAPSRLVLVVASHARHARCLPVLGWPSLSYVTCGNETQALKWQTICARGDCCPYAGHARAKVSGEDDGAGPLGRYRDAGPRSFRPRGTRPLEECLEGCCSRYKVIPAVQYGFFWCAAVRSGHS